MRWLRHVWLLLTHLEIVMYPPLGRMGVWLCDRYETQRYRTRVEDTLVAVGPPTQSGPFAPGGTFNIKHIEGRLPPRQTKVPLLRPRHNLVELIERADAASAEVHTFKLFLHLDNPSEYRCYPLRSDVPSLVCVKRFEREIHFGYEVFAVSGDDYDLIYKEALEYLKPEWKPDSSVDMYSPWLRDLGLRHFVCGYSIVIVLNTEAC